MKGRLLLAILFLACSYCHGLSSIRKERKFLQYLLSCSLYATFIKSFLQHVYHVKKADPLLEIQGLMISTKDIYNSEPYIEDFILILSHTKWV